MRRWPFGVEGDVEVVADPVDHMVVWIRCLLITLVLLQTRQNPSYRDPTMGEIAPPPDAFFASYDEAYNT